MNFRTKLERANKLHKMRTGEIVTSTYIAAILWPKSKPDTQRTRLSQSKSRGYRLNADQIKSLKGCFPFIPISLWVGDDKVFLALEIMSSKFTAHEVNNNHELMMLWSSLNNDLYPETLVRKYL